MTPRIRSSFPAPWTVAGVALLALASGCSRGSSQNDTLTPVLDQRGLITYRYITAEPAFPATYHGFALARVDRPGRPMPYEPEIRPRQPEADQAYEAYREQVRQRQQQDTQNLLQPQNPRADHDTLARVNEILAQASRNQQQRWIEQSIQRSETESMQLQRASEELDRSLERLRVQQELSLRRFR